MRLTWLTLASLFAVSGAVEAKQVRFATWNLANLWHVPNESLREKSEKRSLVDYQAIRHIAHDKLKADIVGLQELGSPEAARLIFPEMEWELIFSNRYEERVKEDPDYITDRKKRDIFTALAIRRGAAEVVETAHVDELRIAYTDQDGNKAETRRGTAAKLKIGSETFWVISVHLKSGCQWPKWPAEQGKLPGKKQEIACTVLFEQVPKLENWIDTHEKTNDNYVLLGDFNRVMDRPKEQIWSDLNDANPPSLDLFKVPHKQKLDCDVYSADPEPSIDYVVLSKRLWQKAIQDERAPKINVKDRQVSDHCPLFVDLNL
ncbi:MAG: hypothetical protein ACT4SY_11250 [Hyphomicrobiales bacterium]